MEYEDFLASKLSIDTPSGFEYQGNGKYSLFEFQEAIVKWACMRGRAAIFADTGLGKTRMQLAWAHQVTEHTQGQGCILIFAPLCVAKQTIEEGKEIGVDVIHARTAEDIQPGKIHITNYELLEHFQEDIEKGTFAGIVLDESSILKHETSRTRQRIIDTCCTVQFKLSCTATPSPNDFMELGNQAEFLGIMSSAEVLSMFFVHDSGNTSKWRLKGHGKSRFWEWLAQWAVCIKKPSDLSFEDTGYDLPPLTISERIVETSLFNKKAETLMERNRARRETIQERVAECVELVNNSDEQWIVWCNLNDESKLLSGAIEGAVEVKGSDKTSIKEERIEAFTEGSARVIVTKPSIAGFGMNWQHCRNMVFVGLNDSFEQLYQAIRRCYRFGQEREVKVHLISADVEGNVLENIKRKQDQNEEMSKAMIDHMREFIYKEVVELKREKAQYEEDHTEGKGWELYLGDCVEVARNMPDESVDFSIFSPPFASLYTYSNSDRDMGNSKTQEEFWRHFQYLINELHRVLRSGRNVSVHCMNLPTSKFRDGVIGIRDFRGDVIRAFQKSGFIYHSEVCIWKNPVVAMQRTKALGLLWKQLKKDSSMSRQGIPDYVVTFRKLGEHTKPISHTEEDFPVDEWQQLASPCWMDIVQSNTLNRKEAREEEDERHICPLQLDVIQRCIRLWSSYDDVVFSPFTGIGSEGYVALKMGRRFIGTELKRSYFEVAKKNLIEVQRDPSWDKCVFASDDKEAKEAQILEVKNPEKSLLEFGLENPIQVRQ